MESKFQNSNALESNMTVSTEMTTKAKRSYKINPLSLVCRDARKMFANQLNKSGEIKLQCIETSLSKNIKIYPDRLKFWSDFKDERERLLDSRKFLAACEGRNLVSENVADHVVLEGKATVNLVLKEGLRVLGERVQMYNCPLWQDTENLYRKEGSDE